MSWLLTLVTFILILGVIVFVHELGHFLWAKKFGTYIYEFSIGMGPVIFSKKGKDGINYNVRALPIGGFVSMAGEVYEDDKQIPKERCLCNKPIWQRVIVMAAGVINNFILAIIILFLISFIWGSTSLEPKVGTVIDGYPMSEAGITKGDIILEVNGHKISTIDELQIVLNYKNNKDSYKFKVKHIDDKVETYEIIPKPEKMENGEERQVFGFNFSNDETIGLWNKIKYAFQKFGSIVSSMWLTIVGLFSGKISINALSGPVGIYGVVGQSISYGFENIIYLVAYLSINVGIINILPFPAFDGGRIFFLIIEKIKGSPVNQKFENMCHTIGFILLMLLVIYITYNDILNIFK